MKNSKDHVRKHISKCTADAIQCKQEVESTTTNSFLVRGGAIEPIADSRSSSSSSSDRKR